MNPEYRKLAPLTKGYVASFDEVVRIKLVGRYSDGLAVMDDLHKNDWRITRSGPYTDKDMHPRCDDSRFLFIAEKVTN